MNPEEKHASFRALVLITTPKLAKKAADMFQKAAVSLQYQWNAVGTAPNEMIDILGLGSPDKSILLSMLPKAFADGMLKKLKRELKLGTVNSGIAFTLPLTGVNQLILRIMEQLEEGSGQLSEKLSERKEDTAMADTKYALIAVIVNQGYSEELMDVARKAGAGGGTVVHSRRIGNNEVAGFWGLSVQEEREMLFIVVKKENKLQIMQAIGEQYGIRSEAKGMILSLPIDTVLGIDDD